MLSINYIIFFVALKIMIINSNERGECLESLNIKQTGLLLLGLVLSLLAAVALGVVNIPCNEIMHIFQYKLFGTGIGTFNNVHMKIIWDIRMPRILLAGLSGAGLSLCGLIMQSAVQNPLAEPYLLGIASGGSLGAVIAILFGGALVWSGILIPLWAFIGAGLAMTLVLFLAKKGQGTDTVKLILAGAVVSAVLMAMVNFLIYIASDVQGMRTAAFWMMGSLAGAQWQLLYIPAIVLVITSLFFYKKSRVLNAMLLGEEGAITLGIDLIKERKLCLIMAALLTGVIVAFCGIFGFVGLIIPHAVRGIYGINHSKTIPAVIFIGAIFMIWMDLLARVILPTGDLPVGILTALVGGPFFIKLLWSRKFNFAG